MGERGKGGEREKERGREREVTQRGEERNKEEAEGGIERWREGRERKGGKKLEGEI